MLIVYTDNGIVEFNFINIRCMDTDYNVLYFELLTSLNS